MNTTTTRATVPADVEDLMARHPWPRSLVARVVPGGTNTPGWLDTLATAFADLDRYAAGWDQYESTHPAPTDDHGYEAWQAAGPRPTPGAAALAVMSSGEVRMCRLIATLHPFDRVAWHTGDVSFDARGIAFFTDWAALAARP
jgi:hypothetical protein